jgi:hypothetical protein
MSNCEGSSCNTLNILAAAAWRSRPLGGIVAMPAYVTGEGEPYRAQMLLWMIPEGPVLGTTMEKAAGPLLQTAGERLRAAIEAPMVPGAPPPVRVRVASPELADALRSTRPALEIVCAPTPELDDVIASMRQHLDGGAETEQSYHYCGRSLLSRHDLIARM